MKLSFLKRAMKVLDQILGKMLQIWPKNKLSQAFTQAITKHKKKKKSDHPHILWCYLKVLDQILVRKCLKSEDFGPNLRPTIHPKYDLKIKIFRTWKTTPAIYSSYNKTLKKGRNQNTQAFCGASQRFWPKF